MDVKDYTRMLENSKKSCTMLMCEYCGTETPSIGSMCMCSNCECLVTTGRTVLEKKDHLLLDALDRINASVGVDKYDDAISIYTGLIAEKRLPMLMYAAAITYTKYSNYEITKIGYMQPGFMEENTLHRDKAAKLVSSAKRLLTKSISVSNAEIKGGGSFDMIYGRFLAQMKMGSIKGAKNSVDMLEKAGNEYVYDYARMVFESRMEKYDNVMRSAETLMGNERFSVNAFYYIGLALFKKRKIKEARQVLQPLNGLLKSGNLDALLFEVDCQLATSK